MAIVYTLCVSFALVCLYYLTQKILMHAAAPSLPYPPGPRGWPFIGNLLDMPRTNFWEVLRRIRGQYGDIVYVNVVGQPIVVLNSLQAAQDLLEQRSAVYSDRPRMPMAGELCGYADTMAIMPYGVRFRTMRRLTHQFMGSRVAIEKHAVVEQQEAARLLLRILRDPRPESLQKHIRKAAGGIILRLAYGYPMLEDDDPFVRRADAVVAQFSQTAVPGRFLVDAIPLLRYIPDWFPGAGFKRLARSCHSELHKTMDEPMKWVENQQLDRYGKGADGQSFVAMHGNAMVSADDQYMFKMTAGTMYGGGLDTTVSSIYGLFLALVLNPDVQAKAQAEIDRVIGPDRLPTLADREFLPYIGALVKEVLRWNPVLPAGSMPHRLTQDDTYDGYLLPKGAIVVANILCMLHDEGTYCDPAQFNPERFLPTDGRPTEQDPVVACFGFGRRICPGRVLAEATIFLACATVTAVLDVSKAVVDGAVVEPVLESIGPAITCPKEFLCVIKPRSEKAAALVRTAAELDGSN
ncbi:cytochrome P450 [Vararia minispora EC-137]|uniref:Cytochrome P450 n=1 Tax=Vararia minispora EC-137 TaxID=1314806 RepID=A0ACB8QEU3_9AGAM|nr:cytochrome P450 [Vararia minispora EC-137]